MSEKLVFPNPSNPSAFCLALLIKLPDLVLRHGFKGELRKSQVTGLMEKHYPASRRRWKYLGSALVTLVLLAGAFSVMILSLNAQGYIDHGQEDEVTGVHSRHPFFFASVAIFSEPVGLIFRNCANMPLCNLCIYLIHSFILCAFKSGKYI